MAVSAHPRPTSDELMVRNRYLLLADVAVVAGALFLAFSLRFDLHFLAERPEFLPLLLLALALKPLVFLAFGLYRRFWRYASVNDMVAAGFAVSIASLLLAVVSGVLRSVDAIAMVSRAVLLMDWVLTLVAVGSIRLGVRLLGESRKRAHINGHRRNGQQPKRVLVVGAGEAGAMVVREMQRNPSLEMQAVGFLDDDERKHGKRIYGVLVLGSTADVKRITKVGAAEEVIIAMPRASGAVVRAVSERCQALGLRCRTMPGVFELLGDQVSISRLRQVQITDLLRRDQVELRPGSSSYVTGRTVLVTGAGGSIGAELCRQAAHARPRRLVLLGHGENSLFEAHGRLRESFPDVPMTIVVADIRDKGRIDWVFKEHEPDVVFHAAAHKHVHLMEENWVEAITNNVLGTQNLVEAALAHGTERFVAISTDKAVSPSSMMGASKRMAGMIVRDAGRRSGRAFVVVRFGNVLGSRGSVVPYFTEQIARGGPVTITHPEMRRFFMTISEAVHLVLEAGGMGNGGELFVLNMGEPVRIMDLAEDLIRLSGFTSDQIPIVVTGLRAGEKLEEALWEVGAVVEATVHPEIERVGEPENWQTRDLGAAVTALEAAARGQNRGGAEAILCQWVPTFAPSRLSAPSATATAGDSARQVHVYLE
jgi:FlaA1/EpsC-like NDP-sugar epimerase